MAIWTCGRSETQKEQSTLLTNRCTKGVALPKIIRYLGSPQFFPHTEIRTYRNIDDIKDCKKAISLAHWKNA